MRVLFLTPPAIKSHLYIQAPLAWALRTAGHDVRVASQPDLIDDIMRTGLTAVSVGDAMAEALEEVDEEAEQASEPAAGGSPPSRLPVQGDYGGDDPLGELDQMTWGFLRHLCPDPMLDALVSFARSWQPDLVIWDQLSFAGAVAARACGAAHARIVFGTDALVQLQRAARSRQQGNGPPGDPIRDWLEPVLNRYGAAFDEATAVGHWTIDTNPPWEWRPEGPRYMPMRYPAFNGPSLVPEWLYRPPERRRVCMTLGVSHRESHVSEASAGDLIEAVADLDVEVIATLSGEQLTPSPRLPANVRLVEFVPMNVLLPTCSAIIHHGGTGTFAAALEHAVPQLIVPSTYWSSKWYGAVAHANGLQEQGAGAYVADDDQLTATMLREHLIRVLKDPSFQGNAARLRTEMMGVPTPNDIIPAIEKLTAAHGR